MPDYTYGPGFNEAKTGAAFQSSRSSMRRDLETVLMNPPTIRTANSFRGLVLKASETLLTLKTDPRRKIQQDSPGILARNVIPAAGAFGGANSVAPADKAVT